MTNEPAGTTTISGQDGQSRNVSPAFGPHFRFGQQRRRNKPRTPACLDTARCVMQRNLFCWPYNIIHASGCSVAGKKRSGYEGHGGEGTGYEFH